MHQDALTPKRQAIFAQLPVFADFYLAGGTALALQLGHRQSIDFDLFSPDPIAPTQLAVVERMFAQSPVVPVVNNADELTVRLRDTKVTFLHYPFPVLGDFVDLAGLRSLSVLELAATKAYTIGRRGSLKDYVDLHAVVAGKRATLPAIADFAERKYGDVFNTRLFLEQLVWLDDVEDEPIVFLDTPVSKEAIRLFFEEQVTDFPMGTS